MMGIPTETTPNKGGEMGSLPQDAEMQPLILLQRGSAATKAATSTSFAQTEALGVLLLAASDKSLTMPRSRTGGQWCLSCPALHTQQLL